jgi:hypothetical protein
MADPFSLSTQYQDRLDSSTKYLDEVPRFVMEGMKIPGVIAQNRILKNQAAESDQQLSINEQVGAMIKNPVGFIHEFGQLKTAAEMRQFMAKYAVIAASPQGKNIMAQFDKAATLTEDAEQHSISRQVQMVDAKYKADLALKYPGVDFEMAKRQDNEQKTLEQFAVLASKSGNSLTEIKDEWINPDGTANLRLALPGIAGLPRSERLQSNEDVAAERAARITTNAASLTGKTDDFIAAYKKSHAGKVPPDDLVAHFQSVATGMEARASASGSLTNIDYKELSKQKDQIDREARKAEAELDTILLSKSKNALAEAQSKRREITRLHENAKSISDQIGNIRAGSPSSTQSQEAPSFSPGTRVIQNGVTYEFDENGQPQPVK